MRNRFSTGRLGVVIMVLGATSLSPVLLPAQHGSSRFFVRVAGGANYFPFQEWGDFFGKVANSRYLHTPISLSPAISIGLRLAAHHSLSLEVEELTSTSSLPGTSFKQMKLETSWGCFPLMWLIGLFQRYPSL